MAESVHLKAPNGKEYAQPTGLFINNEFVASDKPDNTITSIDPALVSHARSHIPYSYALVQSWKLRQFKLQAQEMWTKQSLQPRGH